MKTSVARVEHFPDPYDHTHPENRLAPHQLQPRALAMQDKIGQLLLGNGSEFAAIARAAGMPAESLVLELLSVARKKPDIRKCTEESIMTFAFDAAKLGLQIGTEVDPVPVNHGQGRDRHQRLEAWVNYKGHRTLAIATGAVRDIWAEVVYEGDHFEMERAPVPLVRSHREGPHFGDMKKAIGVYATAIFPGGRTRSIYLSREKVEAFKKKNRGDTDKATSPWQSHPEAMWKAKAIKVFAKELPQNPRLAYLFRMEERAEALEAPAALPALASGPVATDLEEIPGGAPPALQPPAEVEVKVEVEPEEMSVGVANAVLITMQGGAARMLSELRSSALERVRDWARRGLDQDPTADRLARIATACSVVLQARQDGRAIEPTKVEAND